MNRKFKYITAIVLVIAAVFSFTFISDKASAPESYDKTMAQLEEMQERALGMTASATALATGAAAVPGDATTPIANKLMDLSGYMIIVYIAIMLEKYLLTLTGLISFKILIPVGLILFTAGVLLNSENRKALVFRLASKTVLIAILVWALVPASVLVSDKLTDTYEASKNLNVLQQEVKIDDADNAAGESDGNAANAASAGSAENAETSETKTDAQGGTEKEGFTLKNLINSAKDKAKDIADAVSRGIEVKTEELETSFNRMIEGVAVMIVTTCVVPVCVLLAFLFIIKTVTGSLFAMPAFGSFPKMSDIVRKNKGNNA